MYRMTVTVLAHQHVTIICGRLAQAFSKHELHHLVWSGPLFFELLRLLVQLTVLECSPKGLETQVSI